MAIETANRKVVGISARIERLRYFGTSRVLAVSRLQCTISNLSVAV